MEKTVHRLEEIREYYNLSVSELERKIGYSNKGYGHAIKNESSIKEEIIRNTLEAFPKVSLRWLVTGEGNMFASEEMSVENASEYLADNLSEALKDKNFNRLLEAASDKRELLEMKKQIELLKENKSYLSDS